MVKCECGMIFLPAAFNGKCPKCGKKYPVSEEQKQIFKATIELAEEMNK